MMTRNVARMRFLLGLGLLLIADVVWGGLSLYTSWIVLHYSYSKPVFVVYCSFSGLTVFLVGFCCCPSWRSMLYNYHSKTPQSTDAENEASQETGDDVGTLTGSDGIRREIYISSLESSSDKNPTEFESLKGPPPLYQMSDPHFEPVKRASSSSDSEKTTSTESFTQQTRVRFNSLKEVRFLPHEEAEDAEDSRRSFGTSNAVVGRLLRQKRLTLKQVILLSFLLSFVWVPARLLMSLASARTYMWTLQVFSSLAGLSIVMLTAMCPSNRNDYITVTKFLVVSAFIAGGVVIGWSVKEGNGGATMSTGTKSPTVLPWAALIVTASVLLSFFLVALKKFAHSLSRIDITMFLGFTGMWCSIFCWPLLLVFNYVKEEAFKWPTNFEVWLWLIVTVFLGKAVCSLLWIWGSFLTSPLVGILSPLLLAPLLVGWRPILGSGSLDWIWLLGGCFLMILSFIAICLLHWNRNPDPVLYGLKVLTSWHAFTGTLPVNSGDVSERTPLVSNGDHDENT